MSFEINPLKAVLKNLQFSTGDINDINDLCYGISNAYGNVFGSKIKQNLNRKCADLISEKKCSNYQTDCYMKRPSPPIEFNQIPHFYPKLLKDGNNPHKAYEICCNMCTNTRYSNSCNKNCRVDADAVVLKFRPKKESQKGVYKNTKQYVNSVVFFAGYGIVIIVIAILIWFLMIKK